MLVLHNRIRPGMYPGISGTGCDAFAGLAAGCMHQRGMMAAGCMHQRGMMTRPQVTLIWQNPLGRTSITGSTASLPVPSASRLNISVYAQIL